MHNNFSQFPPAVQRKGQRSEGMPLSGYRFVELTTAWAGPMAGRILAHLGAEVIHLESAANLDSWRHHYMVFTPHRYPDCEAGQRPYNRSALFNAQNINKLSLSLDIKAPGGREVFLDLLSQSDGLLLNFTPGMLERLNVPAELLTERFPELIIVEMPGFGNTGPMKNWTALGPTMEQMAGMTAMIGYGDGKPVTTGPAFLDPVGAYHGAAAMLTALLYREHTGQGQRVEVPQIEAAMHLIGEHLMHAAETGIDPTVDANRKTDYAVHDTFPALGHDEWIVIDAPVEEQWLQLCKAIGMPDLMDDERFVDNKQRLEHRVELKEIISSWSRQLDKHDAAEQLQSFGVPAAAVYKANDTLSCEYLNARQFSVPLAHPEAGLHLHQGLPFRFQSTPVQMRTAAPCFGEHNHYVLRDILGRNEAEILELELSGAIRSVPDQ